MDIRDVVVCPECGEELLRMFGCGWDYDRFVCGSKYCDYEIELEEE